MGNVVSYGILSVLPLVLGASVGAYLNIREKFLGAIFESFAAGAILAMLAVTIMPEAYKESGLDASLATVAGFLVIFVLSKAGI
ncbi:MAG TPA: hypothetical protein VJK26_00580 [Patescibacteria group bacterium]|nr:hypothetical protein [Patescibacteria group bacterium]